MNVSEQLKLATRLWGNLTDINAATLVGILKAHHLSVSRGHLTMIGERLYVNHAGLLHIARNKRCAGIHVRPISAFCEPTSQRWVFAATVFKSKTCRGFVGYGDADPSNVSPMVRGAEMRVAETRAVNRAVRKAYGIGLCSVEEIGSFPGPRESTPEPRKCPPQSANANGNGNGPRVRDRLCQLIRQHQLEPELVKAYAVDYCGTSSLKEASRPQVERFVQYLAEQAERDRDALLCKLNSYPRLEVKEQPKEGAA